MGEIGNLDDLLSGVDRVNLVPGVTPLERGPLLDSGAQLWVKRDDLTGLGVGGNKVRKLEFLCGAAVAAGARSLVTVGAAQSNHCRMTAAAGALLGLEVHLVLSGERPQALEGNQLLDALFGAQMHFTGEPDHHWGALEIVRESVTDSLAADGLQPYSIPIGGSTAVGALGYIVGYLELSQQLAELGVNASAVVHTSSSGGTHAGLVAGQEICRAAGMPAPPVIAIGVAKGVVIGSPDVTALANEALSLLPNCPRGIEVAVADVVVDGDWLGDDYAVPTLEADEAIRWAARRGGWVLDRVYSGKGLSGLLGRAANGEWASGDEVVFIHTGGVPSVFAPEGVPSL
jgi:D-cysteine desulfhydrase family pyridoxal phosphate-dependent enzyme